MYLQKISLINFKNIEQAELGFSPNLNCFVGGNGAGKTNVIDAIHYLSMCKSAFNLTDGQSVRHTTDFFVIEGNYEVKSIRESIYCAFKRGSGKVLKRSGKEYDKLSEHIGLLPVVLVAPCDTSLINESGEDRRRYMNSMLSQLDREYLNKLIKYNHLLAERNKLLKQSYTNGFAEIMDVLDMQLCETGKYINQKRAELTQTIAPIVERYYEELSQCKESVTIEYRSDLNDEPFDDLLKASYERDRIMQHTTVGIHRDDLVMKIGGYPLRKFGSQGQQKSFIVALKLAQYEVIYSACGYRPILLLDDIFDKLDLSRVEKLIHLVSDEKFGQIFLTDSNKVRLDTILSSLSREYKLFSVEGGNISEI